MRIAMNGMKTQKMDAERSKWEPIPNAAGKK